MSTVSVDSIDLRSSMDRLVRDSLGPVLAGVALLHVLFIPIDFVLPPFGSFSRATPWFIGLAAGLGGLAWLLSAKGLHARWAHPIFAIAALMILVHLIDDVRFVGEHIRDLALALVAPVGANNRSDHGVDPLSCGKV